MKRLVLGIAALLFASEAYADKCYEYTKADLEFNPTWVAFQENNFREGNTGYLQGLMHYADRYMEIYLGRAIENENRRALLPHAISERTWGCTGRHLWNDFNAEVWVEHHQRFIAQRQSIGEQVMDTNPDLDMSDEDMLIVIQAAALALEVSRAGYPGGPSDDAQTLWETQVGVILRHRYPHRQFDDGEFRVAIEQALELARSLPELGASSEK